MASQRTYAGKWLNYNDLDPLLIKTWIAVGGIPEVSAARSIDEKAVLESCSKPSALAALEYMQNNPDAQLNNERKTGMGRSAIFEKIKKNIDDVFSDMSSSEGMYLDILFEYTPVFLEKEKRQNREDSSMIEALFMCSGRNLTKLNLYSDTGVYIMDKALRKIAETNTEAGKITNKGVQRILRLTKNYELMDYAFEDADKMHYLKDTVKELVGEENFNHFQRQMRQYESRETMRPEAVAAYIAQRRAETACTPQIGVCPEYLGPQKQES